MDRPKKTARLARGVRAAATLALGGAMIAGAWPQCDGSGDAGAPAPGNVGAELAVTVLGRGRVTSDLGDLDCPSRCFAGILVGDPSIDGGPPGPTLTAEPGQDSRFDHWSLDPLTLGVRARGPSQCSPMLRATSTPALNETFDMLLLHFGETTGKPPPGHEEECADYTRVPVAYAITAHFVENFHQPAPDAARGPNPDILFEPVAGTTGPALDIGVASARVYWRYKASAGDSNSGIASASPSSKGSITQVVAPTQSIDLFDVDEHVVLQLGSGVLEVIQGGSTFVDSLGNAPRCAGVASDTTRIYCRYAPSGFQSSTLYAWSLLGDMSSPSVVYQLPAGSAFAIDEAASKIYFADESAQSIASAPRSVDGGGNPLVTYLVTGESSPRQMAVSSSFVFWLDLQSGGTYVASSASKTMASIPQIAISGNTVRFVSVDTVDPTSYWIGISTAGAVGQSTILRAQITTTPTGTLTTSSSIFRGGLDSVNGLANDLDYVYWTADDGRVYRGVKGPEL